MGILEKFFLWILQTSLTTSIGILILMLILKVFNNHIGVRIKHGLWILVIIRLLVPTIPEMNINLFSTFYEKYENVIQIQNQKDELKGEEELPIVVNKNNNVNHNMNTEINEKEEIQNAEKQKLISVIFKIFSYLWIIGAVILSSIFLLSIFNFKRRVKYLKKDNYSEIQNLMNSCVNRINVRKNIPVFIHNTFKSPCILGIIKPKIYIPEHVLRIKDLNQLSHIFLHELMHYKRKDLFYNSIGVIALSIHWFNPLVWIAINKIKLYREYACDASVLEILGEEEKVKYGMTLINFSKKFSHKNKYSQLAISFENSNQIRGRIKMIKNFKNGSYKISVKAALGVALATSLMFTNNIIVQGAEVNNVVSTTSNNNSILSSKDRDKFLIDSPKKVYDDIEKVEKVWGLKFKIPDFMPGYNPRVSCFQLIKLSDNENALNIFLKNSDASKDEIAFQIFEKDPVESLKKIESSYKSIRARIEGEKEEMNLEGINGLSVTLKSTTPSIMTDEYIIPERKDVHKYFAWQNEGIWYSIEYNSIFNDKEILNLSEDNIEKIAKSIKYPEEIKNVNYSVEREVSTEIGVMSIYDKEDLEKAKKLLGFNPKLPLTINEDVKINDSGVGISGDSDIENNKINYELNSFYSNKNGSITFTAQKNSKVYDNIAENGYFIRENTEDNKPKKIKAEKLNIDNKEVFKYEETDYTPTVEYIWKEDGIYYSVFFFNGTENSYDIAEKFVKSKPID
ncbi:M56 family metallopeptidase [Clostridium weizhouense]|uniref:M56 family metallopeptidase n=1 Tax=Clostridium weizhouense TaxID=2859781 RepID=A0ABS7ANL3_9CLOT|nr:M56 family metallopeptidase [Clostridium weizhouense]MBW6409276.1 M56 family metallopeptidase [Clostridium weizhouense]